MPFLSSLLALFVPVLYSNYEVTMYLIISVLAIVSILSISASIYTLSKLFNVLVEIESFKKSTHSVQFVGASKEDINVSEKFETAQIDKFEKEYREEAQLNYPELATLDGDLELKGL